MQDFAAFHREALFNRNNRKVLWQPRVGAWHKDKVFAGHGIPEQYRNLDMWEINRALGCSARLYMYAGCLKRIESDSVKTAMEPLNETEYRTVTRTPVGVLTEVHRKSPNSWKHVRLKWPVETEEDLRIQTWIEDNSTWEWDQAVYEEFNGKYGDLGAPTMNTPRHNVQAHYLDKMGVEQAVFALYDWKETVETYFRVREENLHRLYDAINLSPIDIINLGDNVHSGTLSPDLFRKYFLPEYQRACEKLHRAGKFVMSHWDGDCRPLLPYARDMGLDGIEAITPEPQGDVTLEEVKEALGDELFYIDGIPAIYFNTNYSEDTLLACAEKVIELFAPKLILGISDEISATGDIERIRLVGEVVEAYNRRVAE